MSRRPALRALSAASASVALVLASAAHAAAPTPGADGAGDPYFPQYGNGGYDVGHYDIAIDYGVASHRLVGLTTIDATATQDLSSFNLDLALTASAVTVDGADAGFTQSGGELVVTPATPLASGAPFSVAVKYAGNPAAVPGDFLGGWFLTSDGAIAAGEPEVAVFWYPSNDHPSDKATFDIAVTTKATKKVISNGVLRGTTKRGTKKTWRWRMAQPMTTYLATVVIGDYQISRGRTPGGVPYLNAVTNRMRPAQRRAAVLSLDRTPAIVDFFDRAFGPYPFDITGGIIGNASFPFSLENQTRPIYSKVFFGDGPSGVNVEVIAHELAHMWWGDSVSVAQWRHIWLNEGFATWSSWFWFQHDTRGRLSANDIFTNYYRSLRGSPSFWSLRVDDPGSANVFDGAVYIRGAMALQALRNKIGGATHTRLLKRWARTHRDGNGTVPEFEAMAEQLSGKDLGVFFDEWLHQANRPLPSKALGFPASLVNRSGSTKPLPPSMRRSLQRLRGEINDR